eukprot:272011-Prorocentrum_lima.AAC.1
MTSSLVGSEMCIRDRAIVKLAVGNAPAVVWEGELFCKECRTPLVPANNCLLYTSDAADDM